MTRLFGLLPLLFYVLTVIALRPVEARAFSISAWRRQMLSAALIAGIVVTAVTELLSAFHLIAPLPLVVTWNLLCLIAWIISVRRRPSEKIALPSLRLLWDSLSFFERGLSLGILAILLGTLLTAIVAAPNTHDAMTYHLARVAHWQQEHSVAFFPTANLRQILLSPWAEYALLSFQLLSGEDHLANMVQWLCFCGCILGVTAIAAQLGASRTVQLFAGLLSATLPSALLLASSTQNDLTIAFWAVCLVHSVLLCINKGCGRMGAAEVGAAFGLALFTKGTALIFAPPFLLWYAWGRVQTRRTAALQDFLVIVLITLGINGAQFARKIQLDGVAGLTLEQQTYRLTNETHSPAALLSNLVRNVAGHLSTPSDGIAHAVEREVEAIHQRLGISAVDPRTTFWTEEFTVPGRRTFHSEDHAGNPLHLLLIGAGFVWFLASFRHQPHRVKIYGAALLAGAFLFCFVLKWQVWQNRLQGTLFVLAMPFCAVVLAHKLRQGITAFIGVLLFLPALILIGVNQSHPFYGDNSIFRLDRDGQRFMNNSALYLPWQQTREFLRVQHLSQVGLFMDWNDFEYPIWQDMKQMGVETIQHVGVSNPSSGLETQEPFRRLTPQAIVTVSTQQAALMPTRFPTFRCVWVRGRIAVFMP